MGRKILVWIFIGLCGIFLPGIPISISGIAVDDHNGQTATVLYESEAYWHWTMIAGIVYVVLNSIGGIIFIILKGPRMPKTHPPSRGCTHVWGPWTRYGNREERTCTKCGTQEVRNV